MGVAMKEEVWGSTGGFARLSSVGCMPWDEGACSK